MHGDIQNSGDRSTVSSSNSRWINPTTKRRAKFDGLEILETHPKRVPARPITHNTRYVNPNKSVSITHGYESIRSDRVLVDTQRVIYPLSNSEVELPESADGPRPLPSTFSNKQRII